MLVLLLVAWVVAMVYGPLCSPNFYTDGLMPRWWRNNARNAAWVRARMIGAAREKS